MIDFGKSTMRVTGSVTSPFGESERWGFGLHLGPLLLVACTDKYDTQAEAQAALEAAAREHVAE